MEEVEDRSAVERAGEEDAGQSIHRGEDPCDLASEASQQNTHE